MVPSPPSAGPLCCARLYMSFLVFAFFVANTVGAGLTVDSLLDLGILVAFDLFVGTMVGGSVRRVVGALDGLDEGELLGELVALM